MAVCPDFNMCFMFCFVVGFFFKFLSSSKQVSPDTLAMKHLDPRYSAQCHFKKGHSEGKNK